MDQSNLADSLGFPSLALLDARCDAIGRYARLRLAILREGHPDVFTTLIFTGDLGQRPVEFDAACRERILSLIEELACYLRAVDCRVEACQEELDEPGHHLVLRFSRPCPWVAAFAVR